MAGKICDVCGKPSGMYPICTKCFELKDKGQIIKCEICGKWHKIKSKCLCKNDKVSQFDDEEKGTCKVCGKATTKKDYDMCFECYNKNSNKKSNKADSYSKKVIVKELDIEKTDIRKKWEAMHQCDDGHYVRSYSEVLIDNWLYHNDIVHAYEKSVFMPKNPEETVLSDFFIKQYDVYIEFWGLNNDYYSNRKEYKIKLYENNELNLINLQEEDIKRLNDIMPRLLYKYKK